MTTDGDRTVVPLALTRRHREDFTAKCVYTASGLLIRSQSWHVPHGKLFMTKERRDARKETVRLSEPYVTMAIVGRDNLDIYSDHMCITHSRHKHEDDWLSQEPTEEIINGIMRMAYTIKTQWERRNRKWVTHIGNSGVRTIGNYEHVPMPDNKLREEMISKIHSISQTFGYRDGWQEMPMFITESEYPRTGLPFKSPRD
jgi:hypothetical protein